MTAPRLDYSHEWEKFAEIHDDPSQPLCHCGLHHARVDYHPYCLTNRQFFAWLETRESRRLDNDGADRENAKLRAI